MAIDAIREAAHHQATLSKVIKQSSHGVRHIKLEQRFGEKVIKTRHRQQRDYARLKKPPP